MRKNKQTWSVKTLVFLALLVAIQLVLRANASEKHLNR